jgi:hypothetical protein
MDADGERSAGYMPKMLQEILGPGQPGITPLQLLARGSRISWRTHDIERAAMIYQHEAPGADKAHH